MRAAATFETKTCQTKSCQKERVPNGGVNTRRWRRKNSSVATSCLRFRIEKEFVSPTRIDNLYEHQSKEGAYPSFSSFRESIQPRSIVRRVFRETFSTRASSLYLSLYLLPYRPRIVASDNHNPVPVRSRSRRTRDGFIGETGRVGKETNAGGELVRNATAWTNCYRSMTFGNYT